MRRKRVKRDEVAQEVGKQDSDVESREPEVGDQQAEAGDPQPVDRNQRSAVADQQAEAEQQAEAAPTPVGPPIRVAAVSYLNAAPLVWGLIHGPLRHRFRVENTLPSQCADALRAGEADAGLIPSIEYQRIENLKIVPVLSISSSGPVRSVLLVSRVPLDRIQSVALDTASRTSACLLEILFQRHFRISPRLVPHASDLKKMLRVCDAALVIGDPALDSDLAGLQAWDLSEEWKRMTGLPFVFAFWAVRAEVASPDLVFAFHESTLHAIVNLRDIIQQEAQRTGLAPAFVRAYLTENIDYSFGEKNLVGLRRFYSLAQELGLLSGLKPLQFIE
jgi:predicted solute-binding protein